MAGYSGAQLAQFWVQAGGDTNQVPAAVAVANAEQGSNPQQANFDVDGYSYGPWQIHFNHIATLQAVGIIAQASDLLDPVKNAEAAIYISGNGQNWDPWTDPVARQIMAQRRAGNASYATAAAGTGATGSPLDPFSATAIAADVANAIGLGPLVAGVEGAASAITSIDSFFAAEGAIIANLFENIGPLIVFIVIGVVGALLLVFAFGDDLVHAIEKVADIPGEALSGTLGKPAPPAAKPSAGGLSAGQAAVAKKYGLAPEDAALLVE